MKNIILEIRGINDYIAYLKRAFISCHDTANDYLKSQKGLKGEELSNARSLAMKAFAQANRISRDISTLETQVVTLHAKASRCASYEHVDDDDSIPIAKLDSVGYGGGLWIEDFIIDDTIIDAT